MIQNFPLTKDEAQAYKELIVKLAAMTERHYRSTTFRASLPGRMGVADPVTMSEALQFLHNQAAIHKDITGLLVQVARRKRLEGEHADT
jgi:hypothetical protein